MWSWNIFDHLTPGNNSNMDWCHANSATFDLDNDAVYLNCRFLGIIKIQYSTKEVLWHMGGTFDQTKLGDDFTFMPTSGQFSDAHHPKYFPDEGRILLYDNGGFSQAGGLGAQGPTTSDRCARVCGRRNSHDSYGRMGVSGRVPSRQLVYRQSGIRPIGAT